MRGSDLSAPAVTMTLDGVTYQLVFNNTAARYAEDVYADVYGLTGKRCNYLNILQEAAGMRLRALQAIYYGALRAGGSRMDWDRFDGLFSLDAIDGFREKLMDALAQSLPEKERSQGNA